MEKEIKKVKKKRKAPKKNVIQTHHVYYEPEIVTKLYRGDHWLITNLNRKTKNVSLGLIHCILDWAKKAMQIAKDLDEGSDDTRPVFRTDLYNLVKYGKPNVIEKNNIKVLSIFDSIKEKRFYFVIEYDGRYYLITGLQQSLGKDPLLLLDYIDVFFPELDIKYTVEEIKFTKE